MCTFIHTHTHVVCILIISVQVPDLISCSDHCSLALLHHLPSSQAPQGLLLLLLLVMMKEPFP